MSRKIMLVPTGAANIASVRAAFERLDCDVFLAKQPEEVLDAPGVVLPGVGAYGPAMETLRLNGMAEALKTRISEDRPTLCICLGMQLLFEESEENPGIRGFGILPGTVGRFSSDVTVPHFGWNEVVPEGSTSLLHRGFAYFANSFRITELSGVPQIAKTDYDGGFISALERGNLLACQFHPELSGIWGRNLLANWLERTAPGTEEN